MENNSKIAKGHVLYDVYNQSLIEKNIDVFSGKYDEHTGVIKENDDKYFSSDRNETIGKVIFRKKGNESIDWLFDYYLIGDSENNLKKVMFLKDFSPFQYNVDMIDCGVRNTLFKGLNIQLKLKPKENIELQLLKTGTLISEDEKNIKTTGVSDFIPKNQFCVIVENTSDFTKEIDLLALLKDNIKFDELYHYNGTVKGHIHTNHTIEEKSGDEIKTYNIKSRCIIENVICDISDIEKMFNKLKVVTKNSYQITQLITYCAPDDLIEIPIITMSYFSANQWNSSVLEVDYPFNLNKHYSLKTHIMPKTKVMYYFYGDGKFEEPRIDEKSEKLIKEQRKQWLDKLNSQEHFEYEFELTNISDKEQKGVIYGFNLYLLSDNFGSDKDVCININKEKYIEMIKDSAYNPFYVKEIEVLSEGHNKIKFHHCDANGLRKNVPFEFKDHQIITPDMVKLDALRGIDGNTSISIMMKPKSKFNIKIRGVDYKKMI